MATTPSRVPPTFTGDPGDEHVETNEQDTHEATPTPEAVAHIKVGLSPFGGIGVNVTDKTGEEAGINLTIEEAEQLGARLIGLAGMLVHIGYMEMAQQQMEAQKIAQKIHLPR